MRARRVSIASLVTISLAAFASAVMPSAAAYDHVHNGGFEADTSGWWVRSGSTLAATVDAVQPIEGDAVGMLDSSGPTFEIRPTIDAIAGPGEYVLSTYVLSHARAMTLTLDVRGTGFGAVTEAEIQAGAWTQIVLPFQATAAGQIALAIRGQADAGGVLYIDAVRMDGAPPVTFTPTAPVAAHTPAVAEPTASTTASPEPTPLFDMIASHLRNPSFEELDAGGEPFAWHKHGGALSGASSPARSGSRAARLDSSTASTKWLYQAVLVDPGSTYAFNGWVWHGDPAVAAAFLRVSWYASGDASGAAIGSVDSTARLETIDGAYRPLTTGPITAPPTARSARLRVMLAPRSSAPATMFVDDVSFAPASPLVPVVDVSEVEPAAAVGDVAPRAGSQRAAGRGGTVADEQAPVSWSGSSTAMINEVLYDPDTEGADAQGEWVEIYNNGDADLSLAGWALRDNRSLVVLPDVVVPARGLAVIAASDSFFRAYPRFEGIAAWTGTRIGNGLGNAGDRLELLAPDGAVVDAISWGDEASIFDPPIPAVPAGHSIERILPGLDTDVADDFVDNHRPSPGRALDAAGATPGSLQGGSNIEILARTREAPLAWLPWTLVALSAAALTGAVGWRAVDAVRARSHHA